MSPERGTKSLDIFQPHSLLKRHGRESMVAPVCSYTDDFEENMLEYIENMLALRLVTAKSK